MAAFLAIWCISLVAMANANCRWEVTDASTKNTGILDLSCAVEKYGKMDLGDETNPVHSYKWSLCSNGNGVLSIYIIINDHKRL